MVPAVAGDRGVVGLLLMELEGGEMGPLFFLSLLQRFGRENFTLHGMIVPSGHDFSLIHMEFFSKMCNLYQGTQFDEINLKQLIKS